MPVAHKVENLEKYDTIYIGFPIWYGAAPNVVNTFCKGYDWSGKTVHAFATSGGSGIGKTAEKLEPYVKGAASVDAKLVRSMEGHIRVAATVVRHSMTEYLCPTSSEVRRFYCLAL